MDYFLSSSRAKVSKSDACAKTSISRNSLYYKPKLPAKDLLLKGKIEAVLLEHKSYGHRRIALALGINKKRVLRVMKLFNLKPKKSRKKPRFKKNKFPKNSAKNLIIDLAINQPNQVWVSDFTYISYQNKFIYDLAKILQSSNIKASMSKKSSPWQNGRQESFYQKFKFELEDFDSNQSQGELIEAIALQIYYYNNKRIHLALKMPPVVFYQRFAGVE